MKAVGADPVELSIFQSAVHSIAEEMGAALRRTALSPNIKERRDYSCAVFDGQGRVIAMGDHMPVHLGSMPMSVRATITAINFAPGDMVLLNDPYAGGTHLPDVFPVERHVAQLFAEEFELAILHGLDTTLEPFAGVQLNPIKAVLPGNPTQVGQGRIRVGGGNTIHV